MKYLVRVVVPFGLHRDGVQLNVDQDFLDLFGQYCRVIAEVDDPEEPSLKPPVRKRKKGELVDQELPFEGPIDVTGGDLHSEG